MKRVIRIVFVIVFLFFCNTNILFAKSCTKDIDCPSSEYCSVNMGTCSSDLSDNNSCGRNEVCKSNNCVDGICRPTNFVSNGTTFGGVSIETLYDSSDCDKKCPSSYSCKSVGYISDVGATKKIQYQCVEGSSTAASTKKTCLTFNFGLPFSGMQKGDCVSFDTGAGDLIQYLVKFLLGSVGTVSVIILIVAGFMMAFAAGNTNTIKKSKKMMIDSLIGLIAAIFSGSALSLINPDLIGGDIFNVKPPNNIEVLLRDDVAKLLNKKDLPEGFNDEKMIAMIYNVAQKKNVSYCILYTFASKESNGKPYAIGHDEKVYNTGSWRSFCSTKTYYTGASFNTSDTSNCGSQKNVSNNDDINYNDKKNLGLDWRYSHGIGMMQITIFPKNKSSFDVPGESNPASAYYIQIGGKKYSAVDLLDPEVSLTAAIDLLASKGFNLVGRTSITEAELLDMFKKYNGAGSMAEQYAQDAMVIYKNCIKR